MTKSTAGLVKTTAHGNGLHGDRVWATADGEYAFVTEGMVSGYVGVLRRCSAADADYRTSTLDAFPGKRYESLGDQPSVAEARRVFGV